MFVYAHDEFRGGSTLGQGSTCLPRFSRCPQIQKLADRSDVSQTAPKYKFSGVPPRTPLGELTALPRAQTPSGSLPPPKNPTPALGPSGLVSTVQSNPLQSWQVATLLMIDFKCRPVWSSYFFRFWGTEKMEYSVMKELRRQCPPPPQIFWARNAPGRILCKRN